MRERVAHAFYHGGKIGDQGEGRIKKLIIMRNCLIQSLFGIEIGEIGYHENKS